MASQWNFMKQYFSEPLPNVFLNRNQSLHKIELLGPKLSKSYWNCIQLIDYVVN